MTSCLQHHQTASAGLLAAAVQGVQVGGNMESHRNVVSKTASVPTPPATCLPLAQCTSRSRPACNLTPHLLIPLLLHGWLQIYGLPMGTHTRLPPAAHGAMLQRSRPAASTTQGRHAVAAGALRFQHPYCSRCLVSAGPAQTATAAAEAGRLVLVAAFQDRVCQSSARWHPCAPVLP